MATCGSCRSSPASRGRWCTELETATLSSPTLQADLRARCAAPELTEGTLDREVEALDTATSAFDKERDRAREATVTAIAHPDDGAVVTEAVKSLESARHAAAAVITASRALRESTRGLSRDLAELRIARRSLDAIPASTPIYLSTYEAAGNAELDIDATPVDLAETGLATAHAATGKTTARFPIVGRHYIDLEVGLGLTGGLPAIPYVESVSNVATIQGKPVDQFVGSRSWSWSRRVSCGPTVRSRGSSGSRCSACPSRRPDAELLRGGGARVDGCRLDRRGALSAARADGA